MRRQFRCDCGRVDSVNVTVRRDLVLHGDAVGALGLHVVSVSGRSDRRTVNDAGLSTVLTEVVVVVVVVVVFARTFVNIDL